MPYIWGGGSSFGYDCSGFAQTIARQMGYPMTRNSRMQSLDTGLIDIRSKEVSIAFLDHQKVTEEKTKWQLINIVLPLVVIGLFGFAFNYFRRKKYAA